MKSPFLVGFFEISPPLYQTVKLSYYPCRLVGEAMVSWFPDGIHEGHQSWNIQPGGYVFSIIIRATTSSLEGMFPALGSQSG